MATSEQTPDLLLETLQKWADESQDKLACRFLDDSWRVVSSLTYKKLNDRSTRLAKYLLSPDGAGVASGDRVMLVYGPGLDFIVAFFACLKAGVIAVPVFPPDPRRLRKNVLMFSTIQRNCQARVALTNNQYNWAKRVAEVKQMFSSGESRVEWPQMTWIATKKHSKSISASVESQELPTISGDQIAFLQYTSGSTSEPKGVQIAHSCLAHNLRTIVTALNAKQDTVVLSWLPQYHDMGLIGAYLGVFQCGGSGVYCSPITFIKDPARWMLNCFTFQATHIQGPNFAFRLAARRFKDCTPPEGFSLASLRHIFNAAEPIDPLTLHTFQSVFGPFGLGENVMNAGYGLAEHTVYVSDHGFSTLWVDKKELRDRHLVRVLEEERESRGREMVSCGHPPSGSDICVVIAHRQTDKLLPEDMIGEIWVDSPSKALGYWGYEDSSKIVFLARTTGAARDASWKEEEELEGSPLPDVEVIEEEEEEETALEVVPATTVGCSSSCSHVDREFLRTGDLGFIHNGEIFVTGRVKDLIIVRGRNHYPQDIEWTVERDRRIRAGSTACFAVTARGEERLVVASELRSGKDIKEPIALRMRDEIVQALAKQYGVVPYGISFCCPRSIPKTTSGKIARQWVRRAWEANKLQALFDWRGEEVKQANDQSPSLRGGGAEEEAVENAAPDRAAVETQYRELSLLGKAVVRFLQCEVLLLASALTKDPSDVDPYVPLIALGMDSLTITQLRGVVETKLGHLFEDVEFFQPHTNMVYIAKTVTDASPDHERLQTAVEETLRMPLEEFEATYVPREMSVESASVVQPRRKSCLQKFCCCLPPI